VKRNVSRETSKKGGNKMDYGQCENCWKSFEPFENFNTRIIDGEHFVLCDTCNEKDSDDIFKVSEYMVDGL
jgi:hypothetical protein